MNIDSLVAMLKQNGATNVEVILNDFTTVFEHQTRINWVFNGRACGMIWGVVKGQGSDDH
jgi:hypothetical protein